MKRNSILALSTLVLIGGCDLKRYLIWSPDGQQAAVIAPDGLRLCNADGKLSEVIAKDVGRLRGSRIRAASSRCASRRQRRGKRRNPC